jgi:hypothetical protein
MELALNGFLSLDKELDIDLVWALRKNLSEIKENISIFQEMLSDSPTEINEYFKKRFELMVSHGAESKYMDNGAKVISNTEKMDTEEFMVDFKKLQEEYADAIDEHKKIQEKNQEKIDKKTISLDLNYIDMAKFGKTIKPKEFPQEFLEFVEYE